MPAALGPKAGAREALPLRPRAEGEAALVEGLSAELGAVEGVLPGMTGRESLLKLGAA